MTPGLKLGSVAAMWAWLAGCGAEPAGPTEPPASAPVPAQTVAAEPAPASASIAVARPEPVAPQRLDLTGEIADITTRFLPSLEQRAGRAMADALDELARASTADDRAGAAAALSRATAALRDDAASPADLDALRLTMAALAAAIEPAPSAARTQ